MRQYKILTLILILSIFNFALAAPVAVRERPKVVSQKRSGPEDDSEGGFSLRNTPGLDNPPPPSEDTVSQITYADKPPSTDGPGSSSGFLSNPIRASTPSPGSTESHADVAPPTMDAQGSLPGLEYYYDLTPVPSLGHASPSSPSTDVWSQIAKLAEQMDTPPSTPGSPPTYVWSQPVKQMDTSPSTPGGPSEDVWSQIAQLAEQMDTPLSTPGSPTSLTWSNYVPPTGLRLPGNSMPVADPLPPPPHGQPGPPMGNQPVPPQSTVVDPEAHFPFILSPEDFSPGYLEELFKGKIKPRISDYDFYGQML